MRSKWSEYICNSPRGGGFTNSIPKERDPKMLGFIMNANYYNFISSLFPSCSSKNTQSILQELLKQS